MKDRTDISGYLGCMEEVKQRSALVSRILTADFTTGREDYDYEMVALNLRKILELIAFSSIMSNLAEYKKAYEDAHRHWNAERIMRDVEKVNPNFYPVSAKIEQQDSGVKRVVESEEDCLSKKEFVKLYKICGSTLHIPNSIQGKKTVNFVHQPGVWLMKIHNLLSTHYTTLLQSGHMWLIVLTHSEDGKAHGYPAEPVPIEA